MIANPSMSARDHMTRFTIFIIKSLDLPEFSDADLYLHIRRK
jgi:hypothetical protein